MTDDHRLPIGTVLAGHTVEQVLGQGGFGITYLVRDNADGGVAALKEFFPADDADRIDATTVRAKPARRDRFEMGYRAFLEEARTLNALPALRGLVRIRGAFEKHATVYALMDFIDGQPLDRATRILLSKHQSVPLPLIKDLTESMLGALQAIHRVGVLHRDIKPGNIMIRRDGQPILIDFGAARPMARAKNLASMFSRRYAAIEQFPAAKTGFRSQTEDGPAIDIFAFSTVLYELTSQSLPPDAEERLAKMRSTGQDPYLPVRDNLIRNGVMHDYPAALLDTIDKGCALLPTDRIASARDMARSLANVIDVASAEPQLDHYVVESQNGRAKSRFVPKQDIKQPTAAQKVEKRRNKSAHRSGVWRMIAIILVLAGGSVAYGLLTQ